MLNDHILSSPLSLFLTFAHSSLLIRPSDFFLDIFLSACQFRQKKNREKNVPRRSKEDEMVGSLFFFFCLTYRKILFFFSAV